MSDLIAWLAYGLLDFFLFSGPGAERRTHEAYREAWKKRVRESDSSIELLRESFKNHSAPGAYVDPDGDALAPWLDAWRAGLNPKQAGRQVKRVRRGK